MAGPIARTSAIRIGYGRSLTPLFGREILLPRSRLQRTRSIRSETRLRGHYMAVRPVRLVIVLLIASFCVPPVFAATAGCKIGTIAELPVTMNGTRPMITAKINGEEARFIVDSGAFFSLISGPSAAQYKLPTEPAPFNLMLEGIGGASRAMVTTVKEFTLAGVPIKRVQFVV